MKKLKKILVTQPKASICIWIENQSLHTVFTDIAGDEFFKMSYLLTNGRKLSDKGILAIIRIVLNRHMSTKSEVEMNFWKHMSITARKPTRTQIKFEKEVIKLIKSRGIESKIDLKII